MGQPALFIAIFITWTFVDHRRLRRLGLPAAYRRRRFWSSMIMVAGILAMDAILIWRMAELL